jgi:hypothetical protein
LGKMKPAMELENEPISPITSEKSGTNIAISTVSATSNVRMIVCPHVTPACQKHPSRQRIGKERTLRVSRHEQYLGASQLSVISVMG